MYQEIIKNIETKSNALGRNLPKLIAVSKMQPNENVRSVLMEGHRVFGENRVQEAASKWPEFQEEFGRVELHLLGPLQTNKAKQAFDLFDVIHSLDRLKLAKKIADLAQNEGRCPDLFVQVNIGNEPQKAGVDLAELPTFLKDAEALDLPVVGLMCIPPASDDPRPSFQKLKELAENHSLSNLSMGMSGDYLIAIEEGATHIRVGSAIFGSRSYG